MPRPPPIPPMLLSNAEDPQLLELFARENPGLGARLVTSDMGETWAWIVQKCAGSDHVLNDVFCAALRIPQTWDSVPGTPRHHHEATLGELAADIKSVTNRIRSETATLRHVHGFMKDQRIQSALPALIELANIIGARPFADDDFEALPRKRGAKNAQRTFTVIALARALHRMLGEAPTQIVSELCNALRNTPGELDRSDVAKLLSDHAQPMPVQETEYATAIAEAREVFGG